MNRRVDRITAAQIGKALRMQRELGFEPAFLSLRAYGVEALVARGVLHARGDRRTLPDRRQHPRVNPQETESKSNSRRGTEAR